MKEEIKYYAPCFSDFFIGYECEVCVNDHADIWEKTQITTNDSLSALESQINLYRTKCLTNNDIELEGFLSSGGVVGSKDETFVKTDGYGIDWVGDKVRIKKYNENNKEYQTIFLGVIPSRNELHKVLKLIA